MSWTKSGTVSLANNSATVYGSGTTWAAGGKARAGDTFIAPGGALYEVESIQSNTQLTLVAPYLGATASGQAYALIHTGLLPAELAVAISDLQSKYLTTVAQLYDWETSTADTVPITNPATGVTANVKPLARFLASIGDGSVAGAFATLSATGSVSAKGATSIDSNAAFASNAGASGLTAYHAQNNGGYGAFFGYDNTRYAGGAAMVRNIANTPLVFEVNNSECGRFTPGAGLAVTGDLGAGGQVTGSSFYTPAGSVYILGRGSEGVIGSTDTETVVRVPSGGTSSLRVGSTDVAKASSAGLSVSGAVGASTGFAITGWGGFYNAANKFGQDQYGSVARMYSSGPDASTRGNYEWHLTSSDGALDVVGMKLDASANLLVGVSSGGYHVLVKDVVNDAGNGVLAIGSPGCAGSFYAVSGSGQNGANAAMRFGKDAVTNRTFNAAGTINAAGADYAEYMSKSIYWLDHVFQKGDLVGIDKNGELTPKYSEAVAFAVKSTNPSYVGGDTWGGEGAIGKRPEQPAYQAPVYDGAPNPGEAPAAPVLSLPSAPQRQEADTDDSFAARLAGWQEQCAAVAVDHDIAAEKHAAALAEWKLAHAAWQEDDDKHLGRVIAAESAHAGAVAQYEQDIIVFEAKLGTARQRVERVAFCGQVPANVAGANPGDWIVPVETDDGMIRGVAIPDDEITFRDFRRVVGKVIAIEADGRPRIIVGKA